MKAVSLNLSLRCRLSFLQIQYFPVSRESQKWSLLLAFNYLAVFNWNLQYTSHMAKPRKYTGKLLVSCEWLLFETSNVVKLFKCLRQITSYFRRIFFSPLSTSFGAQRNLPQIFTPVPMTSNRRFPSSKTITEIQNWWNIPFFFQFWGEFCATLLTDDIAKVSCEDSWVTPNFSWSPFNSIALFHHSHAFADGDR